MVKSASKLRKLNIYRQIMNEEEIIGALAKTNMQLILLGEAGGKQVEFNNEVMGFLTRQNARIDMLETRFEALIQALTQNTPAP